KIVDLANELSLSGDEQDKILDELEEIIASSGAMEDESAEEQEEPQEDEEDEVSPEIEYFMPDMDKDDYNDLCNEIFGREMDPQDLFRMAGMGVAHRLFPEIR